MSTEGVDYSWSRPNLSALKAAGKTFVCRYLGHDTTGKCLTRGEAEQLSAAGLDIVVVFEDSAGRATEGTVAGAVDAQFAAGQLAVCGGPAWAPIYFAVDEDVPAAAVRPYFQGVVSVLGRNHAGVYGSYAVCVGLQDTVDHLWQTYAWSGGRQLPNADLYQYQNGVQLAGADLDLTRALRAGFGGWRIGQTTSITVEEDDDVVILATRSDNSADPKRGQGAVFLVENYTHKRWIASPADLEPYTEPKPTGAGLTVQPLHPAILDRCVEGPPIQSGTYPEEPTLVQPPAPHPLTITGTVTGTVTGTAQ